MADLTWMDAHSTDRSDCGSGLTPCLACDRDTDLESGLCPDCHDLAEIRAEREWAKPASRSSENRSEASNTPGLPSGEIEAG